MTLTDEYYARPSKLKVFVCSQMRGGALAAERAVAIDVLVAQPWAEPWAWEKDATNGGPYSASRICVHHAATSDCMVLILANRLTEVTKQEFDAATDHNVPVFIFHRLGSHPDSALRSFLQEQYDHSIISYFRNLTEFRGQLTGALSTYIVGAVRQRNSSRGY